MREMPRASGLPGQLTGSDAGGGGFAAGSGGAAVGAAAGAACPAATVAAGGVAGALSGIAGAETDAASALEIGATLATVETGSAGGTGLEGAAGMDGGALAATDVGGVKRFILVSTTAAKTESTTMAQATTKRIPTSGPLIPQLKASEPALLGIARSKAKIVY
jgi:hypothetical protein